MNNELIDVSRFLRSKHIKMTANNEWLRECCDYYRSSNVRSSVDDLQNFVYEQWLLADLRDIGEQSLPQHLSNSSRCTLNGEYALQVNEITNIGESCYSQLKKIRTGDAISTACENEEKAPAWQPKHSRCLKLSLTDGTMSLIAMEYQSVSTLREPFIPGFKILLTGPIECRRGVLLLTSRCVEVLGGEADSLLICNATENVLARKLNLEENPNPFNRTPSPPTEDAAECIDLDSDIELDNHSVDSGFNVSRNSTDRNNSFPSEGRALEAQSSMSDFRNSTDRREASSTLSRFSNAGSVMTLIDPTASDRSLRTGVRSCWPPSTSSTIAARKEGSPIIGVVTPITSNKRNAESPPLYLDTKSTKTDLDVTIPARTPSKDPPSVACVSVQELQNLSSKNSTTYVKCVAAISKLIQKPRIKNDKWVVVAEVQDETGEFQITFHDGFLKRKVFGISAFEIIAMKERMITNSAVRDQVDDMIRKGVLKILSLKGQFHIRIIADNELPVVVEVT